MEHLANIGNSSDRSLNRYKMHTKRERMRFGARMSRKIA